MNRRQILAVCVLAAATLWLAAEPSFADAGVVRFDRSHVTVNEGEGVLEIEVERDGGDDGAITVDFATADGSALAGADYEAVAGTLSWADGDDDEKIISVTILDDAEVEGPETFGIALSNATGGATIHPSHGALDVTIQASDGEECEEGEDCDDECEEGDDCDDECEEGDDCDDECEPGESCGAGEIEFDQASFHALESSGLAVVTVEREHGSTGEVSVSYATSDLIAVAGVDYVAASGVLTWADGDDADKTFLVELIVDDLPEGAETVLLTLSDPTGGAELPPEHATARLIITDEGDDGDGGGGNSHGSVRFVDSEFQVIEGELQALITVERRGGNQGNVSVDFAANAGSATAGEDFTPVTGTLNWSHADNGERTFTVPILDDELVESTEEVLLTLANPTGGVAIDEDEGDALLEILDNDGSVAACAPGATTLCLLGGRFRTEITYRTANVGAGSGRAIPLSDRSGLFWFFDAANIEMLFKVIDGCEVPGLNAYWIFYSATTNVDFTMTVTDTATGVVKQYRNPLGLAAKPVQDVLTFRSCP